MAASNTLAAQPHSAQPLRPSRLSKIWKANRGFLFVLPALLIFLIFGLYTVVYSVVLSFHRWNGFGPFNILPYYCERPTCWYVGLDNYAEFLTEANPMRHRFFLEALNHSVLLGVLLPIGTVVIALPLAMALNQLIRGRSLFRTLMMLPMVTAGIAVYYVWSFIYQPDGILNSMLKAAGLGTLGARQGWLGDPNRALLALLIVLIWIAVPLAMLLYLAGLQTIDQDYYDAARIDGCSPLDLIVRITWPMLMPITVIVVIGAINSAFQTYDLVLLMTEGGPANRTTVLGFEIFRYGFYSANADLGVASAMSWFLFALMLVVAVINLRVFRSRTT